MWWGLMSRSTLTNNKKSLNDFCRSSLGTAWILVLILFPTLQQLTAALNAIVPYDWAGYLNERMQSKSPHAPLDGITDGGWALARRKLLQSRWTLNRRTRRPQRNVLHRPSACRQRNVADVGWGSAADAAGLAPGMHLLDVNGEKFSVPAMREAMKLASARTATSNSNQYRLHANRSHSLRLMCIFFPSAIAQSLLHR